MNFLFIFLILDYSYSFYRFTYGHAGSIHKGIVYISGGHDYQIGPYRRNMLSYDPEIADAWRERQAMILARGWHSMASLEDRIYAIGGSDDHEDSMERFDVLEVEAFNPQTDQWTMIAPLRYASSEAGLAVLNRKIYVLGGYSWEAMDFSQGTQVYDPDKGQWTLGPNLPKHIAGASCVCLIKPQLSTSIEGHTLRETNRAPIRNNTSD